jgi:hypothetical protein
MSISVVEAMMSGLVCFVRPVGEIQKYSKHLVNAIHLTDLSELARETFINDSIAVLSEPAKMDQISLFAQQQWQNKPLYQQDLCDNIERVININFPSGTC